MSNADQLELLGKHAPILKFDSREIFFPTDIESFIQASCLVVDGEIVAVQGEAKTHKLTRSLGSNAYLQLVTEQDRRKVVGEQAKRLARGLLGNRLGRVGIFGRILDALFQLSVFLRPTTPRMTTPAAAIKVDELNLQADPVVYGRVVNIAGWTVLHYAYFYVMNDWRSTYRGLNDHEGDWEQIWVYCDPEDKSPVWVAASNHDYRGPDLRRHWLDDELVKEGERPVLYAGAGSHAHYFKPGDYVTRLEVPGMSWLLRLQRWARAALRIPDEAAQRGLGPALGVPFVDIAVGDGEQISDWNIRHLDDSNNCFGDFRGLWGLDTKDPTSSERGPGGPKYGRGGQVRFSWSDPVGFVGLHGTVPPSRSASSLTLEQIETELVKIESEVELTSRGIPLTTKAVDEKKTELESDKISTLLRYRTQLEDLKSRLLGGETIVDDYRAHLNRPAVAIPPPQESGWVLSIWAALSVPLLLMALASIFLFNSLDLRLELFGRTFVYDGYGVAGFVVGLSAFFYLLELLARRLFQAVWRLLIVYAGTLLLWITLNALLSGVITISLYVIGLTIVGAAIVLFIANLRELTRVQRRADNAGE